MRPWPLQFGGWTRAGAALERWLEAERDQLALWLPVLLGCGIAAWFVLPDAVRWTAMLLAAGAATLAGMAIAGRGRAPRVLAWGAAAVALGCALAWIRAERVASPVLARTTVASFTARVERIEPLVARDLVRLRLVPIGAGTLPARVRVNLATADVPAGLTRGARISLRARLLPPATPAVPGAYDYARVAWFDGIGATGRGFAPVTLVATGEAPGADVRVALSRHIEAQIAGSAGGIAAAFVTGDQGAIGEDDAAAMRRAGLAHLLSISGLHVTAVVAGTMFLVLRLLALSPFLALRLRLPLVAALAGAVAAIGYTWLSGAEVPTLRSCVAALLVLVALAIGREAMTLRLVATGALAVLLFRPEALVGPSFQLSFAAVTTIIALHQHPRVRGWFAPRPQPRLAGIARHLGSLLLTGALVELALAPIALFHFHKAGLYGAVANIVAIPLTTFVVMPIEALALVLDLGGLGRPAWWLVGQALKLLLWIAHVVADAPGSVAALPAMPRGAFALMVAGGLWVALWQTRVRWAGLAPLAVGALWAASVPAPDILVTGDGRHVAIRLPGGGIALLRERTGDYVGDMLSENGGGSGPPLSLADTPDARCSPDVCLVDIRSAGRSWRVLATRSAYLVPVAELIAACATADIAVSERRLPAGCRPRWLKLDRPMLARTGGVAIALSTGEVRTVARPGAGHPWIDPSRTPAPPRRADGAARPAPDRALAPVRGSGGAARIGSGPGFAGSGFGEGNDPSALTCRVARPPRVRSRSCPSAAVLLGSERPGVRLPRLH